MPHTGLQKYKKNVYFKITIMKTLKKITILSLIILSFFANNVAAQEMVSYTWSDYKTQFNIPKSFTVQQNDNTIFSAGSDNINLTIYPRKDEKMLEDNMSGNLRTWSKSNELKNLGEVTELDETKLNGYWGVFQEGETKDGYQVFVMLIIDPDYTDTGFYVWLSYSEGNEDACLKILQSFTPLEY
jgi:hypothetical protein